MSPLIYWVAAGLLVVYGAALVMVWRFQERIVYQPPRVRPVEGVPAERIDYTAADGTRLFAYVVGDCSAAPVVILAFHGNADLARWLIPWASEVARETRACVVLPEYRGYDACPGAPTYSGVATDALAALACASEQLGAPAEHTIYYGHSLGSAVAAELAAIRPPQALILQSPFSSARAMARRMTVPGLGGLWRIISRVHYDTVARVRSLAAPVWIAHGDRDLVLPLRMGREVFAAAARQGELLIVPGAGHDNVDDLGGAAYWDWLRRACYE